MSTSGFGHAVERRGFGRRQTQLHAWVAIPGRPRAACLVHDLTLNGALLIFDEPPTGLPFNFKLTIEATRFETMCEVRHQRGNRIGVQFMVAAAQTAPVRTGPVDTVQEWTGQGQTPLRTAQRR